MISLDEVRARCRIVPAHDSDDGREHWVFRGALHTGMPQIHAPNFSLDPSGKVLTSQSGTRAVWHLVHRKALPGGWMAWARCTVPGCVNPACITAGSRQAHGRATTRSGQWRQQPARILANLRNTASQRKITRAVADDILGSNDSNLALAARHGLHKGTVSRVRRGLKRVPGNPFQGLMP